MVAMLARHSLAMGSKLLTMGSTSTWAPELLMNGMSLASMLATRPLFTTL